MIRQRYTNITVVDKFKIIHGDIYDYSLVEYKTMHTKVKIICKHHGLFEQTPNAHIRQKQGCPKCGIIINTNRQRDTTENFISKSKIIFGNTYNYDKTIYGLNAHEKVIITCKKHGDFKSIPNIHLSKKVGCPICRKNEIESKEKKYENYGWSRTDFINRCKGKTAKLYIIRCYNENEEFYKIGITTRNLKRRFCSKNLMPYKYEILHLFESIDAGYIYDLEHKLLSKSKDFKYNPTINFPGSKLECRLKYIL